MFKSYNGIASERPGSRTTVLPPQVPRLHSTATSNWPCSIQTSKDISSNGPGFSSRMTSPQMDHDPRPWWHHFKEPCSTATRTSIHFYHERTMSQNYNDMVKVPCCADLPTWLPTFFARQFLLWVVLSSWMLLGQCFIHDFARPSNDWSYPALPIQNKTKNTIVTPKQNKETCKRKRS